MIGFFGKPVVSDALAATRQGGTGVHRGSRSDPRCVSVSALFDPRVVDMGGELLHVSVPLQRLLVQLDLFQEVEYWCHEEGSPTRGVARGG